MLFEPDHAHLTLPQGACEMERILAQVQDLLAIFETARTSPQAPTVLAILHDEVDAMANLLDGVMAGHHTAAPSRNGQPEERHACAPAAPSSSIP